MDHGKTTSDLRITHVKNKNRPLSYSTYQNESKKINSVVSRFVRHMAMHDFLTDLSAFNELVSQVFRD